jgi:molybdopterin adenylyltransferase
MRGVVAIDEGSRAAGLEEPAVVEAQWWQVCTKTRRVPPASHDGITARSRARLSSGAVHTVVMTVSTSVSRRDAEDLSGPLLAHLAEDAGAEIVAMEVVPDDLALIEDRLHHYVDRRVTFIFTTGGTGLTADDITPEATWAVIAREAPGIAEAMRAVSTQHTPMGMLSRGVAGVAGQTLIVNFPGSPKAIEQLFPVLAPVLAHAAATLGSDGGSRASH